MSFSRSQGLIQAPKKLQIGELPRPLRSQLWSVIFEYLQDAIEGYGPRAEVGGEWGRIVYDFEKNFYFLPADEFDLSWEYVKYKYKNLVLTAPYNFVLDFVQHILQHEEKPDKFEFYIDHLLKEHLAAYTLVNDGQTIAPAATPEEGQALANSMTQVLDGGFTGAHQHLTKAIDRFNNVQFADSIRESIHAVESIARSIDPKSSSKIGPALQSLKTKVYVNEQFVSGIEKIYAYTNSERGLRHPLIEDDHAQADDADALFMIGACASFCSYLVAKGRKAGLIEDS